MITRTIPTGQTPVGLAIGPDAALYYTDNPYSDGGSTYYSRMIRVDVANRDTQSAVITGLPFMSAVTFAPDGTYYLGLQNGRYLAHYQLDGTMLQTVAVPLSEFTDGVAVVVPEPTTAVVFVGLGLLLRRKRD